MSYTVKFKIKVNAGIKELSATYCEYIEYLVDFLKPEDDENFQLFAMPFSKVKPKIKYILKPLRQNFQLTKPFFSLAERRALALLRDFCRKEHKNLVNYNEEVRLGSVPTLPKFSNKLDLNSKVAKIAENVLSIIFGKQMITLDIDLDISQDLQPIQIDLEKNELLLLAPGVRNAGGAQSGTRFVSNLCHS